jgi:hypothetical protein
VGRSIGSLAQAHPSVSLRFPISLRDNGIKMT